MKSCSVKDCPFPSFGKDKKTGTPYCNKHQYLRTDLDRRSSYEKHMGKSKEANKKSNTASKVRGIANSTVNKDMVNKHETRNMLLKLADKLFSNFIKSRDANDLGNIKCPCCNVIFNLEDTDGDGKKVVHPLHFVDRDIYSQRFNEEQVYAGCCYCNLKQHLSPAGLEYQNYRAFLVKRIGNERVTEIEDSRYNVNKLSTNDIQDIITKYKPKNNSKL